MLSTPPLSSDGNTRVDDDCVEAGFRALYLREYASAVRLARFLTGDRDVADDLAQEAFIRLYRQGARVERPAALLRTIVVNVCRSWHTSQQRARNRVVRYGPTPETLDSFERDFDDALLRLSYEQRSVVVLRYWLDMTEAEIATAVGCRIGTVKSRHARALRALRKELP